jgi:hypothetical protein
MQAGKNYLSKRIKSGSYSETTSYNSAENIPEFITKLKLLKTFGTIGANFRNLLP